jgi:hypothetical protein
MRSYILQLQVLKLRALNTVCAKIYSTEMKRPNNITLLSCVSLFLLKETNIHTISVLIYHGMRNVTRAAGAMPRRQTHMRVRDARVSVLYMLAHTVQSNRQPVAMPDIVSSPFARCTE